MNIFSAFSYGRSHCELHLGLGVVRVVRVPLQRQLPISLLDLRLGGGLRHPQNGVIVLLLCTLGGDLGLADFVGEIELLRVEFLGTLEVADRVIEVAELEVGIRALVVGLRVLLVALDGLVEVLQRLFVLLQLRVSGRPVRVYDGEEALVGLLRGQALCVLLYRLVVVVGLELGIGYTVGWERGYLLP
ncbi:MAG: hypothetical protein P4L10_16565 [Acidobacteriaceae bacterium]|nr:hypothetical protein [Acidobacteriaceae bacterium]